MDNTVRKDTIYGKMLDMTPEQIMNWNETYAHGDNGIKWARLIVEHKMKQREMERITFLVVANWVLAIAAITTIFVGK